MAVVSWATDWELDHRDVLGEPPYSHAGRTCSLGALRAGLRWVSAQMSHRENYTARLRVRDMGLAIGLSRGQATTVLGVLEQRGVITAVDRPADAADGRPLRYRWTVGER